MLNPEAQSVAITGLGLVTPLGSDEAGIVDAIAAGRSGIGRARSFDTELLRTSHFAEVPELEALAELPSREAWKYDQGTRLATRACAAALKSAGLTPKEALLGRAGLCVGTSGGGQLQNMPITLDGGCVITRRCALYHARNVAHFQAATLALLFGIRGPNLTFCNASASSGIALAHGLTWLKAGRADIVLVGSGEALTLLNAVALDALSLTCPGPCVPFSGESDGLTLGEGAAFLVLERMSHARLRGARVIAEVLGSAVTSDALHMIANDSIGRGLSAAIRSALLEANLTAEDVDLIKASGTGSQAQDSAEGFALGDVYRASKQLPPVICLEPLFGHANGAAPLLGLGAVVACLDRGVLPKAYPFDLARHELKARPVPARGARVLASSAMGFGGSNAVAIVALPVRDAPPSRPGPRGVTSAARVAIVGSGVVSPFGVGLPSFRQGLREGIRAFAPYPLGPGHAPQLAACVPSRVEGQADGMWRSGARRRDRLRQFALTAVAEALASAQLSGERDGAGTALFVAMAHGAVAAQEALLQSLCKGPQTAATGRMLLEMSRFSVVSEICAAFGVNGFNTSLAVGIGGGLQALISAAELLRVDPRYRYALVVGVDELAPMYMALFERLRLLAGDRVGAFAPYSRLSRGLALGEGAVAFLLERREPVQSDAREPCCVIAGTAMNCDGRGFWRAESDGSGLARAVRAALDDAACDAGEIAAVMGNGHGIPAEDAREIAALRLVFGQSSIPIGCVTGNIGVAEATSSLFATLALTLAMKEGILFPVATTGELDPDMAFVRDEPRTGDYRRTLVVASTEDGANAAALLEQLPN